MEFFDGYDTKYDRHNVILTENKLHRSPKKKKFDHSGLILNAESVTVLACE